MLTESEIVGFWVLEGGTWGDCWGWGVWDRGWGMRDGWGDGGCGWMGEGGIEVEVGVTMYSNWINKGLKTR